MSDSTIKVLPYFCFFVICNAFYNLMFYMSFIYDSMFQSNSGLWRFTNVSKNAPYVELENDY